MASNFYIRYRNYFHYYVLRHLKNNQPVPLDYWKKLQEKLRHSSQKQDILLPAQKMVQSKGSKVTVREIRELIKDDLIGTWTLDKLTIEYIWKKLNEIRPSVIAECGCGISSILLTKYASSNPEATYCISFEQDLTEKERVEERLKKFGLKDFIKIIHTPVDKETGMYLFNENEIANSLQNKKIDFMIIDGPAGPDGCRLNTLTSLKKFASDDCKWYLDDALRDGELDILEKWNNDPEILVNGIVPIGKGLACGIIQKKNS